MRGEVRLVLPSPHPLLRRGGSVTKKIVWSLTSRQAGRVPTLRGAHGLARVKYNRLALWLTWWPATKSPPADPTAMTAPRTPDIPPSTSTRASHSAGGRQALPAHPAQRLSKTRLAAP